jgi:hypothetical protein
MTHDEKALASAAHEFLNDVTRLATLRSLPPTVVVGLFGLFVKKMVDQAAAQGFDEAETMMELIGQFMVGLGMTSMRAAPDTEHKDFH